MVSGLSRFRNRLRNLSESSTCRGGIRGSEGRVLQRHQGHAVERRGALRALQGAEPQLLGVGEVEDVNLQDIEQAVHGFGAEAATGVEKI